MSGGLVQPTEQRGEIGGENAPSDRLLAQTQDAAVTTYTNAGSGAGESHLDSFFNTSGWTRQDAITAATLLNTALFVALVYLEVQR